MQWAVGILQTAGGNIWCLSKVFTQPTVFYFGLKYIIRLKYMQRVRLCAVFNTVHCIVYCLHKISLLGLDDAQRYADGIAVPASFAQQMNPSQVCKESDCSTKVFSLQGVIIPRWRKCGGIEHGLACRRIFTFQDIFTHQQNIAVWELRLGLHWNPDGFFKLRLISQNSCKSHGILRLAPSARITRQQMQDKCWIFQGFSPALCEVTKSCLS